MIVMVRLTFKVTAKPDNEKQPTAENIDGR